MPRAKKQGPTVTEVPRLTRYKELERMLQARQRELLAVLRDRIRGVLAEGSGVPQDVLDEAESSQVDSQEDLECALVHLQAETLTKINSALLHLAEGTYGHCLECGDEIAEARLRALPFASRCRDCEEVREIAQSRDRALRRRGRAALDLEV